MFSKSKPTYGADEPAQSPPPAPAKMATGARHTPFSVLGADVVIVGNVSASVDLHVDGRIEGDLACANLVQGPESLIKGAVVAESARLAGTVDGSICARDLTIQASARVTGDVTYENLTIEQGSQVEGRFAHRRGGGLDARATGAASKPVADQTMQVELLPGS